MNITRHFLLVLFIAIACSLACFFLIHNAFLRWTMAALTIVLTLGNYIVWQQSVKIDGFPGVSSLADFYNHASGSRRWIILNEVVIILAVMIVGILPDATVHAAGVIAAMLVIPITAYSSGYLGIRSVS